MDKGPLNKEQAKNAAKEKKDPDEEALKGKLSRGRVAKLQEWMLTLSAGLAPDSAAIVGASLGRWSDFTLMLLDKGHPGSLGCRRNNKKADVVPGLKDALLNQGDVWLNLLTGAEATAGLLTPEACVAAGKAALSRTVRIIRRVVLHYWVAFLLLAAALGVIIWLAADNLSGAAKVWTQIAAIAGAWGCRPKG